MLQATFPICIQHHAANTGATCWKHVEIKQFDNFQMNTSTNIMGKTKKKRTSGELSMRWSSLHADDKFMNEVALR